MSISVLHEKIEKLPDHKIEEVNQFLDSILEQERMKNEKRQPVFGSGKGMFIIPDDFDEPLEDLKEYMV
jgi:Protein of unknown function (DUF2281)